MERNDAINRPRPIQDYLVFVLVCCCVTLAYLPALNGGFLWDDDGHVCPAHLRTLHGLFRIWAEPGATQQYYPMLHSAFWLEHRLWGDAVAGYHLTNLVLHAASACLIMAIMRQLVLPGAWLAALIFALHPVGVESVAWISEQKNTLSTVFCLGSALVYLRFDRNRRGLFYGLAFLLYGLALLTKTVTATLPIVLAIIFWWQRGRLRWKQDILPLGPWLVLGLTGGLFTAWVERTYIGAQGADFILTFGQRFLLSGRIVWFYLYKLVWPADLIFIYPRWSPDTSAPWQYLFPIALLILAAGLWKMRRWNRGPLALLLIYGALLFPALGFFNVYPFVFSYVADHFQYLASISIIVGASAGLTLSAQQLPVKARQWVRPLVATSLVFTLGMLTWRQSRLYNNAEVLYRDILERNPTCWLAHNNLGNLLTRFPERVPEAIGHYEAALKIKADQPESHFNLANALATVPGKQAEAITHYEAALKALPAFTNAHINLGSLLARDPNRLPEAITHFEAALRINPDLVEAHTNLGTAWSRIPGHLPQAIEQYEIVLKVTPDSAEAHFNLANALAKTPDKHLEAMTQYEAALRLNPDYAEAHCNLAVLLSQIPDRRAAAITHYEAALRAHPEWDFARHALEQLHKVQP